MEHPITPPRELVQQWINEEQGVFAEHIATQAARWGADQELEACRADLRMVLGPDQAAWLGSVRRPKPPSLKEQALQALYRFDDTEGHADLTLGQIEEDFVIIRRALESLPDQ
jgi:hypothetical protein